MRDENPPKLANEWQLPDLANLDGCWYSPQGRRITMDEARGYLPPHHDSIVTVTANFKDHHAGVMTMFVPFDLLPARNKVQPPHLYLTLERYRIRRPFRRPRIHQEYSKFAQTDLMARANHDQAVVHVRAEVKRNRAWWRRFYIPRRVVNFFLIVGALQWMTNVAYVVYLVASR